MLFVLRIQEEMRLQSNILSLSENLKLSSINRARIHHPIRTKFSVRDFHGFPRLLRFVNKSGEINPKISNYVSGSCECLIVTGCNNVLIGGCILGIVEVGGKLCVLGIGGASEIGCGIWE